MELARLVAKRSTCLRNQFGAVLVRDKRILSTGYNGAPKGLKHCLEIGCLRQKLGIPSGERHEICRGTHAEANAIISAAVAGTSIKGATLYSSGSPCAQCTKMILNAEIVRIVYDREYPDELSRKLLEESGIEVVKFKKE